MKLTEEQRKLWIAELFGEYGVMASFLMDMFKPETQEDFEDAKFFMETMKKSAKKVLDERYGIK